MASALGAALRSQQSGLQPAPQPAFSGCVTARISSLRSGKVYVVIPSADQTHELGPCLLPIGLLGVGPSHVDTTVASTTRPVLFSNATNLVVGLKVLVLLPSNDAPVIAAIFPKGS